jgi:hypothetical protein
MKKLREILVERFLQNYVPTEASVADFGGLPFSVDSSLSRCTKLLSLPLKTPIVWRIFAKRRFVVGVKP